MAADEVEGRFGMGRPHGGEGLDHGLALLALPVDPDEEEARHAPVALDRLRRRVAAKADHPDLGGVDPVVLADRGGGPLAGQAAGPGAAVVAPLSLAPAARP